MNFPCTRTLLISHLMTKGSFGRASVLAVRAAPDEATTHFGKKITSFFEEARAQPKGAEGSASHW
jgi:hypothetical protein